MALAAGKVTVGVALFTVTLTEPVTGRYSAVLLGVKVTLCAAVPAPATVAGEVKANVPGVDEVPPVSVEEASVWP